MSIFSWPSERAKLEGYRRMNGYALPLTLWVQFLTVSARVHWRSWWGVEFLYWAVPMLVLWWVTKPLAGVSVESTARWRGCSPEELRRAPGLRGMFGLTSREPWWVTWSVLACWTVLPASVVLLVVLRMLQFEGRSFRMAWEVGVAVSVVVAFALAPVVRWLAEAEPARSAGEESRAG